MQLHDFTQHIPEHLRPESSPRLEGNLDKLSEGGWTADELADELTRAVERYTLKHGEPPRGPGWTVWFIRYRSTKKSLDYYRRRRLELKEVES